MAKRKAAPETLSTLLATVIRERRLVAWAIAAGVRPNTVGDLLDGKRTRANRATVTKLAEALGIGEDAVRAAIKAQRAAKG